MNIETNIRRHIYIGEGVIYIDKHINRDINLVKKNTYMKGYIQRGTNTKKDTHIEIQTIKRQINRKIHIRTRNTQINLYTSRYISKIK